MENKVELLGQSALSDRLEVTDLFEELHFVLVPPEYVDVETSNHYDFTLLHFPEAYLPFLTELG